MHLWVFWLITISGKDSKTMLEDMGTASLYTWVLFDYGHPSAETSLHTLEISSSVGEIEASRSRIRPCHRWCKFYLAYKKYEKRKRKRELKKKE